MLSFPTYLRLLTLLGLVAALTSSAIGADDPAAVTGKIEGRIIDALTQTPVLGASVLVVGTSHGDATDDDGRFEVTSLPPGSYAVSIRSVAHEPVTRTDVVVRPGRISFLNVELHTAPVQLEGTVVHAGYFAEDAAQPTSTTSFSGEEVRRSPGSAGDVSRIIATLPSIAKVNDQLNSLLVRGGTPTENAFYIDNIMIPNINHYPIQGTSGGPISLINVDFVDDLSFSAGGFSAIYGDRLSAIMDISFREGNRQEFDAQLDMNFAGLGLTAEGPLFGGKGSYLVSARRSYLDLLVDAIGTGVAPKYSDYQGKLVLDLGASDQLSVLGIVGVDKIEFDKEQSIDDGNIIYGTYEGQEYSFGANWRHLWGQSGHSNTSISFLGTHYLGDIIETKSDMDLSYEDATEQIVQLRNVNTLLLGERDNIQFGLEAQQLINDYEIRVAEYTSPLGDTLPPLTLDERVNSPKLGAFASFSLSPARRLTTTVGARADYFDYNERSHISPRLALTYRLTDRTSVNLSTGLFYQNLPLGLLMQHPQNRNLEDPHALHYVAGVSHLITENTQLTVEAYLKDYYNFPLDSNQAELFVADEIVYRGFFGNYEDLLSTGRARSYGLEATLQKKLVQGLYGLVSGAFFKARYRDYNGDWRDRVVDNRLLFAVEGGYQPNNRWEYSARWIFAGGAPYTPLDPEASAAINRSVLDRSRVNDERYPAYHSLNLRVEHRYLFKKSSIVAFISIWNVYNRQNVAQYYWNEIDKKEDVIYQWSTLPIAGFEWEF